LFELATQFPGVATLDYPAQQSAQMELGALGEHCRCGAEKQTTDHILASCPLYHPPSGTLGLATLDDDTVDWLKTTALNI